MPTPNLTMRTMYRTSIFLISTCMAAATLAVATPVFAAEDQFGTAAAQPAAEAPAALAPRADQLPANPAPRAVEQTIDPLVQAKADAKHVFADRELKPGEFAWVKDAGSASGEARVLVDMSEQRAYLYRGDRLVAITTVSTGRPGHATPLGTFRVLQKRAVHFSSKYNNAPMPYMHRLTDYGIALHAGQIPGHPASHGCVRLPHQFAAKLFSVTKVGTTVVIAA